MKGEQPAAGGPASPVESPASNGGLSWRQHALVVAAIVLAPSLAYAPAMNRVFTIHDTLWYLAELEGSTSLWDGLALVDYNRVAKYQQGDTLLFRPVFFAWSAVQNAVGGYDHVKWNVLHLAAHVGVCVCLYVLLLRVQPSLFAGLAAVAFSVHLANFDLVTWNQPGVLPAFALLLLAMVAASPALSGEGTWTREGKAGYLVSMTLACFAYELAVGASLMVAVIAAWGVRREGARAMAIRAVPAAAPCLVYLAVFALRWWFLIDSANVETQAVPDRGFVTSVVDSFRVSFEYLLRFVAFGGLNYVAGAYQRTGLGHHLGWDWPASGASQVLAAGIAVAAWLGFSRDAVRARVGLIALVLATIVGHALMLCLGRGYDEATSHGHYMYLFGLFATVLAYSLVDWRRLPRKNRQWLAGLLLAATALNAGLVRVYAENLHRSNARAHHYLSAIAEFVETHENEPNFSFRIVDPPHELDPRVTMTIGRQSDPRAPTVSPRASEILFARHYRETDPRYELEWTGESLRISDRTSRGP